MYTNCLEKKILRQLRTAVVYLQNHHFIILAIYTVQSLKKIHPSFRKKKRSYMLKWLRQIIVQYEGNLGQWHVLTVLRLDKNQPLSDLDMGLTPFILSNWIAMKLKISQLCIDFVNNFVWLKTNGVTEGLSVISNSTVVWCPLLNNHNDTLLLMSSRLWNMMQNFVKNLMES